MAADRGFDDAVNQDGLARKQIYNGVGPRSPRPLQERLESWKFQRRQRRRARTEGRSAILKEVFGAGHPRGNGFAHRQLTVTWAVLVHDLWVWARLQRAAAFRQPESRGGVCTGAALVRVARSRRSGCRGSRLMASLCHISPPCLRSKTPLLGQALGIVTTAA